MTEFPRGSEWRKWDLHLHAPGTRLSDGYKPLDWDRYCGALESSDVVAFGITDYFCFDGYREVRKEFTARYADSQKLLLPNLELRLNEAVNKATDTVDIHLIFRPDTEDALLDNFLADLLTEVTDDRGRNVKCSELSRQQLTGASVTRDRLRTALETNFGRNWGPADVIILVPASNNGIRAESGKQRKMNIADEIDKFSNAIFGGSQNVDWYLNERRFEDQTQRSTPKPVFAGSDAHSYDQLVQWLGKSVDEVGVRKEVTWIKADPTYEGLLQTLIEPSERVRIRPSIPDSKDPYKYISKVTFSGSVDFPTEPIELNSNLVSVIGSRSSGKSALLAYIAHAIDPSYTIEQQELSGLGEAGAVGPAAGLSWDQVEGISCQVAWGDSAAKQGRVIYIPQNSLYSVSERPKEITAKIRPALYRLDPGLEVASDRARNEITTANDTIRRHVEQWFALNQRIATERHELRDIGDPEGVRSTRDRLTEQVQALREASALTAQESADYQQVVDQLAAINARIDFTEADIALLDALVQAAGEGEYEASTDVDVVVSLLPSSADLPSDLRQQIDELIAQAGQQLRTQVRARVSAYRKSLDATRDEAVHAAREIEETNAALIAKNRTNAELEDLVNRRLQQEELLRRIGEKAESIKELGEGQGEQLTALSAEIDKRGEAVQTLVAAFQASPRELDGMTFGIEQRIPSDRVVAVSNAFNRQENTEYFDRGRGGQIDLDSVMADPEQFLVAVASGNQKIRVGESKERLAADVFALTPDIEFFAALEGDRIGGFERSSMTPGKQALFALTLIINESDEAWPLLIDQPEDDLDSRSIFKTIVPYLMRRKVDRQILMVSHDANMVIGADSEQVIVANRHGKDRKNRNDQMFAYLSGALEWTAPVDEQAEFILESCGIREHAIEILDGGEDAFQKRRDKYKM